MFGSRDVVALERRLNLPLAASLHASWLLELASDRAFADDLDGMVEMAILGCTLAVSRFLP